MHLSTYQDISLGLKILFAVFGRSHKFQMIFIILIFGNVPLILLLCYSRS